MLSLERVDRFLVTKLGLSDWRTKFQESPLDFLQRFVLAFSHNIYFQNLSFSALPLSDRKCPTPESSFDFVLERSGACCIHNNFVAKEILRTLGLDAFNVACSMPSWPDIPNCHVLTIVRLKQPMGANGDENEPEDMLYTLDVGYARPNPQMVPLNRLPFRGKVGGFEFEVRFNLETGNYERILIEGCCGYGKFKEGGQKLDYYFNLTPMEFHDFDRSMTKLFMEPESTFMGNIFLYRLTRVGSSVDDFDYLSIRRKSVLQGTKDTFKEIVVESFEEFAPFVQKYFPNVPQKELIPALQNYMKYEEEYTYKMLKI